MKKPAHGTAKSLGVAKSSLFVGPKQTRDSLRSTIDRFSTTIIPLVLRQLLVDTFGSDVSMITTFCPRITQTRLSLCHVGTNTILWNKILFAFSTGALHAQTNVGYLLAGTHKLHNTITRRADSDSTRACH